MVVARVHAQVQRQAAFLAGGLEQIRPELFLEPWVVCALVDENAVVLRDIARTSRYLAGVVVGPGGLVLAEVVTQRFLPPWAVQGRGNRRKRG